MPILGYDGHDAQEEVWGRFRRWLTETLAGLQPFDYIVLDVPDGRDAYVQAIHSYGGRLGIEASGPIEDGGHAVLTPREQLQMLDLGWSPPSKPHYPNYRVSAVPEGWSGRPAEGGVLTLSVAGEAAALIVDTLWQVLGADSPSILDIRTDNTGEDIETYWVDVDPRSGF
jgi:hypothetical protein